MNSLSGGDEGAGFLQMADDNIHEQSLITPLDQHRDDLLTESAQRLAIAESLFAFEELELHYQAQHQTLWTYMRPKGRPSFNLTMLGNFYEWQRLIGNIFGADKVPLRHVVLASRTPDVFSLGGDLELFQRLIREENRQGLVDYGYRCVEILDRIMCSFDLPITTIGLVQGAALGGGFEAVLAYDVIIAEKNATFGLPEVVFGLFPGMGAHSILSRKLGTAMAERLISSNVTYSAEQMYELGIVHHLAEPGEGVQACLKYIEKSRRRHTGLVGSRSAMREASRVPLDEMKRIVDLWADTALQLSEYDLKVMSRLTRAQSRLTKVA